MDSKTIECDRCGLEFKKLSPYERGQVNYFFAYVRYLKGDSKGAITYYKRVVADPNVPDGLVQASKFTIAQLYFQLEEKFLVFPI